MMLFCIQYLYMIIFPLCYYNTKCRELRYAASVPIDLEVKAQYGVKLSGLYFLPVSIAASISFVWKTLPIFPRYLRLYSRSNEGDCFAFSISSAVYILPMP